jgi:hypothetical protein
MRLQFWLIWLLHRTRIWPNEGLAALEEFKRRRE